MLQVLVAISQKFCYRKETGGYAKVVHKKKLRKNGHKSVQDIENNGYLDAHLKKEKKEKKMNKDSPHSLAKKYFQVSKETYFQGAK
jgi:hypothetical protein